MEKKTIFGRMAHIKAILSETKIAKSGHNKFAGFKYHELSDFLNVINRLNNECGVCDFVEINKDACRITLVSIDDATDRYEVSVPYSDAEMLGKGGAASNVDAVQRLGSTVTYIRRYLYMTAYNIQENDGVDSVEPVKKVAKPKELDTDTFYGQFEKAVINGGKSVDDFRAIMAKAGYVITELQEELILKHK